MLELDTLQVVGKNKPEIVHTILGRADTARSPDFIRLKEAIAGCWSAIAPAIGNEALAAILEWHALGAAFGMEPLYTSSVDRIRKLSADASLSWAGVRV